MIRVLISRWTNATPIVTDKSLLLLCSVSRSFLLLFIQGIIFFILFFFIFDKIKKVLTLAVRRMDLIEAMRHYCKAQCKIFIFYLFILFLRTGTQNDYCNGRKSNCRSLFVFVWFCFFPNIKNKSPVDFTHENNILKIHITVIYIIFIIIIII